MGAATHYPLIPAKAGTQIIGRYALEKRLYFIGLSLTIWVPAFAGMSGVKKATIDLKRSGA